MKDRVLQRLNLENRKKLLKSIQLKINSQGLNIDTHRGSYKIGYITSLRISEDIREELKGIDKQLEELTGLNQEKMEQLYKI